MPTFVSDGINLAYETYGEGAPVLLIHGFGSSGRVNWVETGWTETLTAAGYQAITIDNRGHGESEKLYDPERYYPWLMADDAARLLAHLGIRSAPVIGYSMGARIAAFLASRHAGAVACAVFGGMGPSLMSGLDDSEEIIAGLLAPTLADVPTRVARQFRIFADRTRSDRRALAACMATSRSPMEETEVRRIAAPILVVVGSDDTMAGAAEDLAALIPKAEAVTVPGRDHMLTTGDRRFKEAALDFLARHAPAA